MPPYTCCVLLGAQAYRVLIGAPLRSDVVPKWGLQAEPVDHRAGRYPGVVPPVDSVDVLAALTTVNGTSARTAMAWALSDTALVYGRYKILTETGGGKNKWVSEQWPAFNNGYVDIILGHFSRICQLHPIPHAPCATLYVVPVVIGCRLVLGIRCCDPFGASGPALRPSRARRANPASSTWTRTPRSAPTS